MAGAITLIAMLIFFVICMYGEEYMEHRERMAKTKASAERDRLKRVKLEAESNKRHDGVDLDK